MEELPFLEYTVSIGDRVRSRRNVMHLELSPDDRINVGDTGKIIDYSDGTFVITLDRPLPGCDFVRTFDEHMGYFWETA